MYAYFQKTNKNNVPLLKLFPIFFRYHLKGQSKGKLEIFIDNLPGNPDNIRSNGHGGYWVPLCVATPPNHSSTLSLLGPHEIVRKVIARLIYVARSFLRAIDYVVPSASTKTMIYKVEKCIKQ